jgi:NAD(P)-dependent dehydrogenase (short-subunit alcohol dehydrogenase family)
MATQVNGTFTGKVAFVTGAGGGIGRTTAMAFAREGASVAVADVSEKDNQETARMIEEQGGRAIAVRCDAHCFKMEISRQHLRLAYEVMENILCKFMLGRVANGFDFRSSSLSASSFTKMTAI